MRREMNREHKRRAMVEAGRDRMLAASVDMLRSVLNASSLGAAAGIPKDTAYRVFREADCGRSDPIVRAVSEAATEPRWAGFEEALAKMAVTFEALLRDEVAFDEAIVEAMTANIEAQFSSPGGPVGWLFHAAALTASPAWQGTSVLSDEDASVGRDLLAARAAFYRRMTDELAPILSTALSLLGRRPKEGLDVRRMVSLMHALIDGAVLRMYVEPDVFSSRQVGEAVLVLALAFSEDGWCNDPRYPPEPATRLVYESTVAAARRQWAAGEAPSVAGVAGAAGVEAADAASLFPTLADLADSVLWSQVLGGGSLVDADAIADDGVLKGSGGELAMLFGLMRRLRQVVDELPELATVVRLRQPVMGGGIGRELERQVREVLSRHCPGVDAAATASELVEAALAGSSGWPAAATLMRVLQRSAT